MSNAGNKTQESPRKINMNEIYTELYNKTDGLSEQMLQFCIDYTNRELRNGKPGRLIAFMFQIYQRSRTLEAKVRETSKEIYHERLPKQKRLRLMEFANLLDADVKVMMNERYRERSPFWPEEEA